MTVTKTTAPKEKYRTKQIDKVIVELSRKQAIIESTLRECGKRHGSAMFDEAAHQCIVASRVCSSAFVALSRARSSTGEVRARHFEDAKMLLQDASEREKQITASVERAKRRDDIDAKSRG